MELKALMFLYLDNGNLQSVIDLSDSYKFESHIDNTAMKALKKSAIFKKRGKEFVDLFRESCLHYGMDINEADDYADILRSVLDDYAEFVPHLDINGRLSESALTITSRSDHICEVCGEEISRGDELYLRTSPGNALRHPKCNSSVRSAHEYAQIEFIIKEIEWHEKIFASCENSDYSLSDHSGLTHKIFYKKGFITDRNGIIRILPNFGAFVTDYLAGEEDYELIKKYRPYHVYLEFLLKMKGLTNQDLQKMSEMKYLLREDIGKRMYPFLWKKIENTAYSELLFDKQIYSIVDADIKRILYSSVVKKLFSEMGIYSNEGVIFFNDEPRTYSVNEKYSDSEISVTVDKSGIVCTDRKTSLPFEDYFGCREPNIKKLIDYAMQFEVIG